MNKFTSLAFVAALSMGLFASGAMAQAARVAPPPPSTGTNFPTICIAACPPPSSAGESNHAFQVCGDKLAQLRRVTVRQVRHVDRSNVVHIVPLCDTVNHSLTQQQETWLSRGNVQGLIPTIGTNPVLMGELDRRGYDANAVIGIALAPDAAVLYVSRR